LEREAVLDAMEIEKNEYKRRAIQCSF
ncbi:hypothetical protein LCGC14_2303640, partial [marine sediment metagenome]